MILYNWTGLGLREDPAGSGKFGASRGKRTHAGYDRLCKPGQVIKAPMAGKMMRSFPYANDKFYTGVSIWADDYMVKMWYFSPFEYLIINRVARGQEIGIAQNISDKYGGGMKAHVHLGLWSLNPTTLLNPEDYLEPAEDERLVKLQNGGH